ncbi:MAG: 50S ribosomal protein L29 [Candidatus Scalindua sp. AMX11]|nr:MAG: 50S ribosomal protein L29 [Candidatus Scalindua sp.]NOG85495.1 50S ribosomal protein L29 [Planctomycetota bacterium]RZV90256.1 MAG: 50S ribosomal protein L29 [Candidatus Scalindua sp. SCAELEC01]TDE64667.1 MAG: 50S ribosomal protein L29 [Candidatus Scalindua sp. AMX11]GJQ57497.1 MAG: 50S ribosomal protein L29 [Candidatus Scalindua sp.]
MKPIEIREKLRAEMLEELDSFKRELLNLRFQWQAGEQRNTAQYRQTRKEIARIKTIMKEMDLGINKDLFQKTEDRV